MARFRPVRHEESKARFNLVPHLANLALYLLVHAGAISIPELQQLIKGRSVGDPASIATARDPAALAADADVESIPWRKALASSSQAAVEDCRLAHLPVAENRGLSRLPSIKWRR